MFAPYPIAAQSCDPTYVSHYVPPIWEVGDLDCQYFYDQGIYNIQLADPYNDPMVSTATTSSMTGLAARATS